MPERHRDPESGQYVPDEQPQVPLDRADVLRRAEQATLATIGALVLALERPRGRSLRARAALARELGHLVRGLHLHGQESPKEPEEDAWERAQWAFDRESRLKERRARRAAKQGGGHPPTPPPGPSRADGQEIATTDHPEASTKPSPPPRTRPGGSAA